MDVGKVIHERRKALGWTQEELGSKLATTGATINRWENGERQVKVSRLEQIATVLGIQLNDLTVQSATTPAPERSSFDIDPMLLAAWQQLNREGRKKLVQIAVILAQKS